MVHRSSVPLYWRLQKPKYTLTGTKCQTCQAVFYPPKNLCPACRRKGEIRPFRFSGRGKILSYTTIRIPPGGFERYTPYVVGIIELEEGTRISGQIIGDPRAVKTGMKVVPVFRKMYEDGNDGIIHYGVKYKLVENSGEPAQSAK